VTTYTVRVTPVINQVNVVPTINRAVVSSAPRGPEGPQGLQGIQGIQGEQGVPGTSYVPGDPILVRVRNQTNTTLTRGTVVYPSGAVGDHVSVSRALASSDSTSARTFGLIYSALNGSATVPHGEDCYVIVEGYVDGLVTQGTPAGTQVYLSGTTAGTWTTTKPVAPIHLVYIGVVVREHPNNGVIAVKVQNGYEIDELHDVLITSKANGDLLQYEASTGLWKNKSQSTLVIGPNQVTGTAVITSDSRLSDSRTPTAHKTSHSTGGSDALIPSDIGAATASHNHTGTYDPAGTASSVVATHESDTTNIHGIADTSVLVVTSDSRLTNARTPTAHASSHGSAGSDAITIAPSQVTGTAVVTSDSRLSDARTPTTHKATHATGGSDALTPSDIGAATSGHTHATYVDATTVDAKGDLLVGTANDTLARQGVGTDGYVLTADTSTTTGVSWKAPPSPAAMALVLGG